MTDKQKLHEAFEELEYDDDYVCPTCRGSGEGMYDGSTCYKCKGTGGYPKQYKDSDYD
jgi:DnaJ-class molecular chaperone